MKKLKTLSKEIEICGFCPLMCKNVCCFHLHAKTEASAPTMRNLFLWYVQQNKMKLEDVANHFYECTLCGQCTSSCRQERDIPNNMIAAREAIVEQGIAPKEVLDLHERTIKDRNPYGENHTKRCDNFEGAFSSCRDGNIVLFSGCTSAYYQSEILLAFSKIVKAAGVEIATLGNEEWCCGLPQYKLGLAADAVEMAEHNAKIINESNCETIVTTCPTCYTAFTKFYPSWGVSLHPRVMHSTEFIEQLVEAGRITLSKKIVRNVTYHDPCDLARPITPEVRRPGKDRGFVEIPRRLLGRIPGVELVEMRSTKFVTYCCGGDTAVRTTNPDVSRKIGTKVPIEALNVKANVLATACPSCKRQFSEVVKNNSSLSTLEVRSICELVADAMD